MKPEFAIAKEELRPGVTLIEASAGTGKTYTIAGLFLRFVVEQGIDVRQILVTTYTVAATAELRERIRSLLRLALEGVRTGQSEHPLIRALLPGPQFARPAAEPRLAAALRAFDQAAIHTIHGFCERVLRERALECGALFNAELIADPSAILRELAEDYWRTHFYSVPPALIAAVALAGVNPGALAALLKDTTAHPQLHIEPSAAARAPLGEELEAMTSRFRAEWPAWRDAVRRHFLEDNAWAKSDCAKREVMMPLLDLVDLCASDVSAPIEACGALAAFTREKLQASTKARAATPEHEFFQWCSDIVALRANFVATVEADFLAWARAELPKRMAARNVLSFDDLLTRLLAALQRPGADALVRQLRAQFSVALIDEFQDTDPTQSEIFGRIFADNEQWLYYIGDPKQAIYGFRGADLRTYLAATSAAVWKNRLPTNQRSTAALVAAVNAIFERPGDSFILPGITFDPVSAAGRADGKPLLVDGVRRPPFRFWMSDSAEPLAKTATAEDLPARIAAEIARLLDGRATLNGKPLAAGDCAVLTLSNRQARAVRDALGAAGIPSVLLSDGSVFDSDEAGEMRILLAAIAEPARHGLLRSALATGIFAQTALEIEALAVDEGAWERWLLRFQSWNELWRAVGFMRMFRTLLRDCGVRPRFLSRPDGERALTNLLHLAELLHQAACEQRRAPSGLLQWFAERQGDESTPAAEHELRLERDDDAVKIVTVHKSKGLEYEIVFCPFAWGDAELRKKERPRFHDATYGLTLDLHWPRTEASEMAAVREKLEEQTRLLYVALTRAKHECHFVWGRFKKVDVSAGNWLLHRPAPPIADPVVALTELGASLTPQTVREEIVALASRHPAAIAVDPFPDPQGPPYRAVIGEASPVGAREFRRTIDRSWRISSFTSLTEHRESESPDYDRAPVLGEAVESGAPPAGIHAFPAGKTPGVFLHAVFEFLDFKNPAAVLPTVTRQLAAHGFSVADWSDLVADCVRQTLAVELAPGLKLGTVALDARLTELEFYFRVEQLEARALSMLLQDAGVERLSFDPRSGLLKGFIDLVFEHDGRFFIADWKSNRLGPNRESYREPALRAAMLRQHYGLQYHLYTVALHRYLKLRLGARYDYDQHFGGVFYIFLRGVDPAHPELGIFRDRPPRARIEALDAYFASDSVA